MIKLTRFQSNTNRPALAELHGRTVYINEKLILSVETVFPYTVRSAADLTLPLKEKPREKATQITYAFGVGEEPFSEMVQESVEEVLRRSAIGAGGQAVAEDAETLKARAASVLCEAGALCGWPAPNCNAREGAEALFKAGLLALSQPHPADERVVEALETYYARQIEWSKQTFGPAKRTNGILAHIRKELAEIAAKPDDLSEWVDVVILAMDGFWRHGGGASDLMPALLAKQQKNMARTWPDWRTMSEDSAIEHDRSSEASLSAKEGR